MERICGSCGTAVGREDHFCMTCGADLEKAGTQEASMGKEQALGIGQEQEPSAEKASSTEPLTVGNYLLMLLVMVIPGINLIFLFMWAFGEKENINRRNFSKAALLYILTTTVITILCVIGFVFMAVCYFYQNVEPPIPNEGIERFLPEPSNDRIVTFTSFEKEGNVEISKNGARMI